MTDELRWHSEERPRRPVLIVAFEGLFDVAEVATSALNWLVRRHQPLVLADIDPEAFIDFAKRRPTVSLDDSDRRVINWPANELRMIRSNPHDLIILSGVEPHFRWATFAGLIVEACLQLGVELVVTLGAVPDAIPHTRTPVVFGSSTTPGLGRRLGLSRPQYQGPTGVVGVLHDTLDERGIPAIALRAPVPHYALAVPHPKAWQALLRHIEHVTGCSLASGELDSEVRDWQMRHDAAVAADRQVAGYVRVLEHQWDQRAESSLPSGDDLAEELERFLRDGHTDEE